MKTKMLSIWRNKKLIPALCLTVMLLVCMVCSCITVSKYTTSANHNNGGNVVSFTPSVEYNSAWDYEGDFSVTDAASGLPFAVDNQGGEISARLTITLTVDEILPFTYVLTANGTPLTYASVSNGVYTYYLDIGAEKVNFLVFAHWIPDKFDERLNGLVADFSLSVFCEQTMGDET